MYEKSPSPNENPHSTNCKWIAAKLNNLILSAEFSYLCIYHLFFVTYENLENSCQIYAAIVKKWGENKKYSQQNEKRS